MRVLALDIGGTWLRADIDGRVVQARTPENGRDALAATLELAGDAAVDAVGVSFGGRVHGDEVVSLHVPGWEEAGLADALRERYGPSVTIANDANAGAVGEWDAAGRPDGPVAYVTVSTGVGAGIVVDGRILEGSTGLAGEIGHLVVDPDGEPCACGKRGCVETLASGPALARHGDYAVAARALGIAVDALRAVVDPAFVAIGGGVATAPQLWEALGVGARRAKSTPLHGARVLALLIAALLLSACGGGTKTFTNPVFNRDFPDPFVLKVGDTYYAYATNGGGSNVQTATSKDLVHWTAGPDALPKLGSWDFTGNTWAPEVAAHAAAVTSSTTPRAAAPNVSAAPSRSRRRARSSTRRQRARLPEELGGSIDASPIASDGGLPVLEERRQLDRQADPDLGAAPVGRRVATRRPAARDRAQRRPGLGRKRRRRARRWWQHDGRYYLFYSGGDVQRRLLRSRLRDLHADRSARARTRPRTRS